ncbi:hypothetical protein CHS0354_027664 [Potamilus streckersoni]|uniref:Uncharacterized protein n=1 Tax=Potamilus streckersoni TaxID=2493646 RepID=A0AAE0T1K9_9BIVA|nr:hypothetical protein CHS0354_027664 [Potamilus streckersoni]
MTIPKGKCIYPIFTIAFVIKIIQSTFDNNICFEFMMISSNCHSSHKTNTTIKRIPVVIKFHKLFNKITRQTFSFFRYFIIV